MKQGQNPREKIQKKHDNEKQYISASICKHILHLFQQKNCKQEARRQDPTEQIPQKILGELAG